ncbi:MAG: penicillin-binding protein [Clostridiales bacterium]|nr:penicillin-binding protein [Clostridiales bacterium]
MFKKIFDRQNLIGIVIIAIVVLLIGRLANLTIINGEYYSEKALNNRIKQIPEVAKRGEIYDRNGILLAGNVPAFTVQFMGDSLSSEDFNQVAIDIIDILDDNQERHINLPIIISDGEIRYSYDLNVLEWLESSGYDGYVSAENIFNDIRYKEQISEELDNYEAQNFLLLQGIKLPISVRSMKYLSEIYKENFLKFYGIALDATAKEALDFLRNIKSYGIDESVSDEEAIKILTLRYALKEQGYMSYNPIKIADNVSQKTAVLIEEMGMELPGINISIEPIRSYPNETLAAHILGYLGKISSEYEIQKFVDESNYNPNDLIGKVGIEGEYESVLRGDNGYRYIEVDAYGRLVKEVEDEYDGLKSVEPQSGGDIKLTIDLDLQKAAEESLAKWIPAIQNGGIYEDKWGTVTYEKAEKAESGAVVVLDVSNGEVLALANYPTYDPNLFTTGISTEDWDALSPENARNPLAPRPLFNTATLTAVQPGSTFKMITGIAAMEQGLDPDRKLDSNGYVEVGNNIFGCWYWNDYHLKHGPTDLYKALEVSCNYYFFNLSMGMDYKNNRSLGIEMNASIMIDYAKKFGLNESTGIEIEETVRGVPDEQKKKNSVLYGLKIKLNEIIDTYFPIDIVSDDNRLQKVLDEIISWADENPSRSSLIKRLIDIGAYDDYYLIADMADIIKYDYFNRIGWFEGDTLNMAIGQGDHLYSPLQMARYIMAVSNGGYLYELSLVDSIDDVPVLKNQGIEPLDLKDGTLDAIKKGMYQVVQGTQGTARTFFYDFPVDIGAKTGTAEKEGKIPPADEVDYLTDNLKLIDPILNIDEVQIKTEEVLRIRNEELAAYERSKDESDDDAKKNQLTKKIDTLITSGYLTSGSAMREAIKLLSNLELNDTIINQYREDYDSYAWFVGFAPFDNPEIAIVVLIPQGGHGGYGSPIARDIIAEYLSLEKEE